MEGLEVVADAQQEVGLARRVPRGMAPAQIRGKPKMQAFEHRELFLSLQPGGQGCNEAGGKGQKIPGNCRETLSR